MEKAGQVFVLDRIENNGFAEQNAQDAKQREYVIFMLSDEMKICHPTWTKYFIFPAIILLLCISYAPILLIFLEDNPNYQSLYIILPIAIFFTYFSFRGYALFKYRNVVVKIKSNNQIVVKDKNKSKILSVADVSYKNYKMLTFVELFDKNNQKIAAFDHIYPNVENLIKWAENHLTTQPR